MQKLDVWHSLFAVRLAAYEKVVDSQRARFEAFESERLVALERLKTSFPAEIKTGDELLGKVAPISRPGCRRDPLAARRLFQSHRCSPRLVGYAGLHRR